MQELKAAGVGSLVQGDFAGAGSYCDYLVLLSPRSSALQAQMSICEDYAMRHNLVFFTHPDPQKSKVFLNDIDNALPWVDKMEHHSYGCLWRNKTYQDPLCRPSIVWYSASN